ncbi:MAG: hypothetical protein JWP25_4644 [Bradyrhizobium sp.]|nr:hypothetical protein [Bradyrhizobium sp.]
MADDWSPELIFSYGRLERQRASGDTMRDIVEELRFIEAAGDVPPKGHGSLAKRAADEIERLRGAAQSAQETPTVPFNPCLAKLRPGEPFFVLLGRDKQAPNAVMTWANDRQAAEGKSAWTDQAREVAHAMATYSGIGPALPTPARGDTK